LENIELLAINTLINMTNLSKVNPSRKPALRIIRKIQLLAIMIGFTVTTLAFLISLYPHKPPQNGDSGVPPYLQDVPAVVVSYPTMLMIKLVGLDVSKFIGARMLLWLLAVVINCSILFLLGTIVGWQSQSATNDK
jgi:hypothetical protein